MYIVYIYIYYAIAVLAQVMVLRTACRVGHHQRDPVICIARCGVHPEGKHALLWSRETSYFVERTHAQSMKASTFFALATFWQSSGLLWDHAWRSRHCRARAKKDAVFSITEDTNRMSAQTNKPSSLQRKGSIPLCRFPPRSGLMPFLFSAWKSTTRGRFMPRTPLQSLIGGGKTGLWICRGNCRKCRQTALGKQRIPTICFTRHALPPDSNVLEEARGVRESGPMPGVSSFCMVEAVRLQASRVRPWRRRSWKSRAADLKTLQKLLALQKQARPMRSRWSHAGHCCMVSASCLRQLSASPGTPSLHGAVTPQSLAFSRRSLSALCVPVHKPWGLHSSAHVMPLRQPAHRRGSSCFANARRASMEDGGRTARTIGWQSAANEDHTIYWYNI